ncbi:hypothetical protein MACK_003142 [Theileria orientalis]|uniref:Uncharacterized protein n=1 Tax=Theileria orientalis TaxID=68886 RepID=A0A976QW69_THEOR|nr:hypothetical protein MACK_003142 [Theileria orientalis]
MKINTISAYVLVYLLARGHWNLMVPVRAEEESDASSTGSASADAGSSSGTPAEGSSLATPASESGSTASPDAGLTAGDGSGHVAGGSDAGQASPAADELGSLYPDFFTGGMSADEAPVTDPVLVAKKEEAKLLVENAKKAADDLMKTAQQMIKNAEELSITLESTSDLDVIYAKVDAAVYNFTLEKVEVENLFNPPDMMYYSGFPNGWHAEHDPELEKDATLRKTLMHYSGFPDGWHFGNPLVLRDIRRHELKGEIAAKTKEIEIFQNVISDLTTQMEKIDAEVKNLEEEHNELVQKLLGFDALLIKLYKADAEGNPVLMEENTDFEKKKAHGDIRFDFKGVKCTKVMYGVHELWKKGDREVEEPKLVAFNDTVNVLAVRDNDRAVLFKKETNSDKWYYHNTIERKRTGTAASRTAAQAGSSAGSTLASSSALAGSKMNLEAGSTGTPETPESLDETASVASGEGNDANEADSGTALRGSTVGSADGGSSSGGEAATEYSSVFME